jgi:hypothetical protein
MKRRSRCVIAAAFFVGRGGREAIRLALASIATIAATRALLALMMALRGAST